MIIPNVRDDSLDDAAVIFCDYSNFLILWQQQTCDEEGRRFLHRSHQLLERVRARNVAARGRGAPELPIVHCCVAASIHNPDGYVSQGRNKYYQLYEPIMRRKQLSFAPEFKPLENELIVPRPRASSFRDTGLFAALRQRNVQRIYITGVTISESILATVIDCGNHDMEARVVRDCVFEPLLRVDGRLVLDRFIPRMADLTDLAAVLTLIDREESGTASSKPSIDSSSSSSNDDQSKSSSDSNNDTGSKRQFGSRLDDILN